MRMVRRLVAALVSASPLALCAAASESAEVPARTNAEPIVVTATRTLRERSEVPASVSVVSREDLDASAAVNVDDALRAEPGVAIMRSTGVGQGMVSQVLIRGVPGDHRALLLVDGMPLNEANTGFLSFNEIPIRAVNQVEVIRGPFSSLYGTDAFAGVVNILTDEGAGAPATTLSALGGSEGSCGGGLLHSGGSGRLHYLLNADYRTIDNYLARDYIIDRRYDWATRAYVDTVKPEANNDYSDGRALGKFTIDLGEDSHLALHARYYQGELGYGQKEIPYWPTVEDNITRTRTALIGSTFTTEISRSTDLRLAACYRDQKRELWGLDFSHLAGTVPVYARSFTENTGREWRGEAGMDVEIGRGHTLSYGVDFKRNAADFPAVSDDATGLPLPGSQSADASVWNTGVYIQDEAEILQNLRLVAGIRLDDHSEFDEAISPKLGLLYQATPDTALRASAGRAFRAPTMVEMFQPPLSFGYLIFESNPELKPEYITAADVGIEQRILDSLSARFTVFYNDMDDLIENVSNGDVLTNVNIDKARSAGLEAEFRWKACAMLDAVLSYTFQDAENKESGESLEYIPRNMGALTLRAHARLGKWKIEGNVTEMYMGGRGYINYDSAQWYDMNEYWRTDASLKGALDEGFWLGVGVQNATDEKYQESRMSVLAPGRLFAFEAGTRF